MCVTDLATISPLPVWSVQLDVVKKVLRLCRSGELADSSLFHTLAHQLASLFKATYSLLKVCCSVSLLV